MRYRLRTLMIILTVIAFALAASSANFLTLPLRDSDKEEAARSLVAWIVDGRRVPGFRRPCPDAKWMPTEKHFFVICDLLPLNARLSKDPRVQRISDQDYDAVFKQYKFNDTVYMTIELKEDSPRVMVLELATSSGSLAGHGFQFEFRRKLWGLRARGKLLWVS